MSDETPGPGSREAAETTRFDEASKQRKAGHSVDLRLFFREREDGSQWASLSYLDPESGHRLKLDPDDERGMRANVRLKDPADVAAFSLAIAERGFAGIERKPDDG